MGFRYISAYFRHRLVAKTRHGTHSPFVYKLADEVIYDFSPKKVYEEFEAYRKKLLHDDNLSPATRKQLQPALKTRKQQQLLFRLVAELQPRYIIEIGADAGITTAVIMKASPRAKLLSLMASPALAHLAKQHLGIIGLGQVEIVQGDLYQLFIAALSTVPALDLVYIGGRNTADTVLAIFEACLSRANEATVLMFEHLYWSEEMQQVWEKVKQHPQVSITIDLFGLGLVYFRKGQAREHFKLRF